MMKNNKWHTELHAPGIGITFEIKKPLFHTQTKYQSLDVFETETLGNVLLLEGLVMTTEKDEYFYHEMLTHVPLSVLKNPENVLIVGGGDGGTVRECLKYPGIKKLKLVEIDEEVVIAAKKYFPTISEKLNDPKLDLEIGDGVKYVQGFHGKPWDVILIDSTDPIGPAEQLFSETFYRNIKKILKKDGVLAFQSESPFDYFQISNSKCKKINEIFNNLQKLFKIVRFYFSPVPTYPFGQWSFIYASDTLDPIKDRKVKQWDKLKLKTRYYNSEIHCAAFALPQYIKEKLFL